MRIGPLGLERLQLPRAVEPIAACPLECQTGQVHVANVIEDMGKRPDLGQAVRGWQAQEEELIARIVTETFEETLVQRPTQLL